MTTQSTPLVGTSPAAASADEAASLRPTLGAVRLIFLIVAAAAPMAGVLGVVPVAFAFGNGMGLPLTFLAAAVILGLFTVGYNAMSKEVVNVGAFYAYIARGFGGVVGLGAAFLALLAYLVFVCGVVGYFSFFAKVALADVFGIEVHWVVPAAFALVVAAFLGYRRIDFSSRMLAVLLSVEFAVLLALNVSIVGTKGIAAFPSGVLSLDAVWSGAPGIAIMLAFTCFIGVESAALYAEETHSPSRTIGIATFGAVLLTSVFYFMTTWITIGAVGPDVQAVAQQQVAELYFNLGNQYVGGFATKIMMVFLATSMFATHLAIHNVCSRYIFALGRQACLPAFLGRPHPVYASPHAASVVVTLVTVAVVGIAVLLGLDPLLQLGAVGIGFGTVGVIALQAITSVAVIAYFRRKGRSHWWTTVLAPLASFFGLAATVILAVKNFDLLTGFQNAVVLSLPALLVIAFLAGGAYAGWLKRNRPSAYAAITDEFHSGA
ncbi:APC family permease [Rhizobium lusitanum]|uniref:APC family permease n=1 Tax=Rhizobium lusitanum TaxID=293958 RepID=UPI00195DA80E|nr:APC family permease [Rhizobium lusitanum]MBM7048407.1 APC family permease [Rhizobium lusitanum]